MSKSKSKSKSKICLNMIVKDEAHIIHEVLESVSKYIDYYIISDTGSSDNTINIIKNFFNKKNITGEVHQDKWVNFGYNRTLAIKHCNNSKNTDIEYIWVIDADDVVRGNLIMPILTKDCYYLKYGKVFTYSRAQIFKLSKKWEFKDVLHEYPVCKSGNGRFTNDTIQGDYHIEGRTIGNRSKDPDKYKKDAITLEKALLTDPSNTRYLFYLAQSYKDSRQNEKSITAYKKRIAFGGWYEEIFYSHLMVGDLMTRLKKPSRDIVTAYLKACKSAPHRAEAWYRLALHFRTHGNHEMAYNYGKKGINIPFPLKDKLFIAKDIYDYRIKDEVSIACYYTNRHEEAITLCKELLINPHVPKREKTRIEKNMNFSKHTLTKNKKNKIELDKILTNATEQNQQKQYRKSYELYKVLLDNDNLTTSDREQLEDNCYKNIQHFYQQYTTYPKNIINKLSSKNNTKNITFAITTSTYNAFCNTMNSFINCCQDIMLITNWQCITNITSQTDKDNMIKLYPFFNYTFTPNKTQPIDMNIVINKSKGSIYLIHTNDQFQYIEEKNYIIESLDILDTDKTIGQVLFNKNSMDREPHKARITGGHRKRSLNNFSYILHEYCDQKSPEYKKLINEKYKDKMTILYWAHFSLKPSLHRYSIFTDIGKFSKFHQEYNYSLRYVKKYKSVFFDSISTIKNNFIIK